jgi:predicted RNase H-like HicB family nuclease
MRTWRSAWGKLVRGLRWRTARDISERWGGWRRSWEEESVESFTAQGRWDEQGDKWVVSVDDPPHFGAATAEGHSRTEAKDGITDLLALLLGHRNFSVQVSFEEELRG